MSGSDSPTFFHGQPWSSWIERIGRDKPLNDEETEVQASNSVTRLSSDDIDLYGFCPERDDFYGVVCEICDAIVKPQALIQHIECRHSGMANFPPPTTPVTKPSIKTPFCKVSKLKRNTQPSVPSVSASIPIVGSAKLNHTTVKRTADQANLSAGSSLPISSSPRSPLESITVQTTSSNIAGSSNIISASTNSGGSPSKSPGPSSNSSSNQPRRKRLKTDRSLLKDREYDPDRHCGVLNEETGKPCTRSLTCKAHTVSLRRTAVDLLYRCLAPHGSTKPTKLEEDFVNSEELRNLESTLVVNSTIAGNSSSNSSSGSSQQQSSSMMAPISVMLPSLSPLPGTNSEESSGIATLIPSTTTTPTMPVVPAPLPTTCIQPPTVVATVLEGETPMDIDETISMYSPVYTTKDAKSQLLMQIQSRPNSHSSQSPLSVRNYQQMQVSMPSLNLFEPVEQLEQQHASQINGKRLNHASSVSRQQKRHKSQHEQLCQSSQDFPTSASIQVEATTTSSPYPHFGDISWSNCHPEPLAVSRWLRISSSRKQYNFNIH
ncbi:Ataxin-7-like protein 2 [Acromyrmex echinatior]|uniref:Ataxin-7-like protein 2 n=1 Tax=Acromyrmex echinatior TaxID=103372 RepID=F4WHG5_ACREC|nr:Ataxin-7-like protein 2 [Acromyrmex echinatior]